MSPRAGLTRDRIVDASLELLRAQPDRPLTMRLLATHLGVDPMALYRHVRDKRELVAALSDRALSDGLRAGFDRGSRSATAHGFAAAIGRSLYEHLVRHPELIPIVATAPTTMTSARYGVEVVARLVSGGVDERTAIIGVNAVVAFALGSALLSLEPATPLAPIDADELSATLSTGGSPVEVATVQRLLATIDTNDFDAGLAALLTGLLGRDSAA